MTLGFHESETLFALIAPFLYSNDLATASAINYRTWQQQHSNTADIKTDYERWRDWVTDKHYEEWCNNENDRAARDYYLANPVERGFHMSDHYLSGRYQLRTFLSNSSGVAPFY